MLNLLSLKLCLRTIFMQLACSLYPEKAVISENVSLCLWQLLVLQGAVCVHIIVFFFVLILCPPALGKALLENQNKKIVCSS